MKILVTLAEAVALTGKSETTLRRWIAAGALTPVASRPPRTTGRPLHLYDVDQVWKAARNS